MIVGLVLGRGPAVEAVHEPAVVVPVHPVRGDAFDVGEAAERPVPERGVAADAIVLVHADSGLGEGVVLRRLDLGLVGSEAGVLSLSSLLCRLRIPIFR